MEHTMSQIDRALEQAEQELTEGLTDGTYTQAEFNERMRDLGREARDALEEEAEAAYDDVMYQRGGYR